MNSAPTNRLVPADATSEWQLFNQTKRATHAWFWVPKHSETGEEPCSDGDAHDGQSCVTSGRDRNSTICQQNCAVDGHDGFLGRPRFNSVRAWVRVNYPMLARFGPVWALSHSVGTAARERRVSGRGQTPHLLPNCRGQRRLIVVTSGRDRNEFQARDEIGKHEPLARLRCVVRISASLVGSNPAALAIFKCQHTVRGRAKRIMAEAVVNIGLSEEKPKCWVPAHAGDRGNAASSPRHGLLLYGNPAWRRRATGCTDGEAELPDSLTCGENPQFPTNLPLATFGIDTMFGVDRLGLVERSVKSPFNL